MHPLLQETGALLAKLVCALKTADRAQRHEWECGVGGGGVLEELGGGQLLLNFKAQLYNFQRHLKPKLKRWQSI